MLYKTSLFIKGIKAVDVLDGLGSRFFTLFSLWLTSTVARRTC